MTTRPEVGRTRVLMQPRVVLLPAPLGPSRPKNSPASTPNEIPRTASTGGLLRRPGYVLTKSWTDTRGIAGGSRVKGVRRGAAARPAPPPAPSCPPPPCPQPPPPQRPPPPPPPPPPAPPPS